MATNSGSSSNSSKVITLIDLTQSPEHQSEMPTKSMKISDLSPPPFISSASSTETYKSDLEEKQIKKLRPLYLPPPPSFNYVEKSKTFDNTKILKEAKSMKDGTFEFLWSHQQEMSDFAATAGGQTTCLRTLFNN